ncbi:MAG: hypothetical protein DWQ04_21375, partial [Chloroflexi bacterium]
MRTVLYFSWIGVLLVACGEVGGGVTAVSTINSQQSTENEKQEAVSVQPSAVSVQPSATALLVTPTLTPQPTVLSPTATATATPNPYAAFTIDALASREYGGGVLEIVEMLEE